MPRETGYCQNLIDEHLGAQLAQVDSERATRALRHLLAKRRRAVEFAEVELERSLGWLERDLTAARNALTHQRDPERSIESSARDVAHWEYRLLEALRAFDDVLSTAVAALPPDVAPQK